MQLQLRGGECLLLGGPRKGLSISRPGPTRRRRIALCGEGNPRMNWINRSFYWKSDLISPQEASSLAVVSHVKDARMIRST